jgi:class 3 adenylate cyclase
MTPDELRAAGLFDPDAADAPERLNLLRLIEARGGSLEHMLAAARDGRLERLAADLLFRPEPHRLTAEEVASRAGTDAARVRALWRASGFTNVEADDARFTDADIDLVRSYLAAAELFGDAHATQLLRVVASAVMRIADATVSTFIGTVGATSIAADPDSTALQDANVAAAALLPGLIGAIDTLLRHHLVQAARPNITLEPVSGFEKGRRAVAFVDLVGSTELSRQLPLDEVAVAVQRFETAASDLVTDHAGRVVKFVGDAVMFTAKEPGHACRAALEIVDAFADDAVIAGLRGGVAFGDVVVRDGDCYGPVVNLAARAVAVARTATVVVSDECRDALAGRAPFTFERLPPQALKGFAGQVVLHRVRANDAK